MLTVLTVPAGVTSSSITVTTDVLYNIYGTANNFTIQTGGSMTVFAAGTANSTYVQKGGALFVYEGGKISQIEIQDGALLNGFTVGSSPYKLDSVVINSATVESGDSAYVFSGQQASGILVSSAAILHVSSGGSVSNVSAVTGATVNLLSGITASDVTLKSGVVLNGFTLQETNTDFAVIAGATVASGIFAHVYSGRTVNSAVLSSGANVFVSSGGVMSGTTNLGYLTVSEGGRLNNVNNSATLNIYGGIAYVVDNTGDMYVSSGLVERFTQSAGVLHVENSGFVSNAVIGSGSAVVSAGGSMNQVSLNGGHLNNSAGAVENLTVFNASVTVGHVISNASDIQPVGAAAGSVSRAIIGNGGVLVLEKGRIKDVTVNSGGSVKLSPLNKGENDLPPNSITGLVISSGARVSAYWDNYFYNTTIYSGGVMNGFTAVDSNVISSGITYSKVEVSSSVVAQLYDGHIVSSGVVKSGGTINLSSGISASAGDLTVEKGALIHLTENSLLVLNGKTTLNNGGGIMLDRHIIYYGNLYESDGTASTTANAVDVFRGNITTSCFSPVSTLWTATISGASKSRSKTSDEWPADATAIPAMAVRPFGTLIDGSYYPNILGSDYNHDNVDFYQLQNMSTDKLTMITSRSYKGPVYIESAGGSQARIRFDFTSNTTLAANEAMLNDISLVSIHDTGVPFSSTFANDRQLHDDPRYEFVYTSSLKDAYFLADGAQAFGVEYPDQFINGHKKTVLTDTFRIVGSNGNALMTPYDPATGNILQLNVLGKIGSWTDAGVTVSARLMKEDSHLYMELYRDDPSTRAEIFVPTEFTTGHPYFLTSDTEFAGDKTYYTLSGGVYTPAAVTSGTVIPADTYYEKKYTNADVVVTAQFSQNTQFGTKKYDFALIGDAALNNQVYKVYDGVTFTKNGQVTFKGTGADGQAAVDSDDTTLEDKTVVIDWIDKIAPAITVSQNPAENGQVTVFAEASDIEFADGSFACSGFDSQRGIEYRLNNETDWTTYTTGVTVNNGDVVHFQAYDMAGNRGEQDHTAWVFELTATATAAGTTEWTNGDATITVYDVEGTTEVFQYSYTLDEGENWTPLNRDAETDTYHFDVSANADVLIRAIHEKFAPEDNPLTTEIKVNHIDKVDPEIISLTCDPVTDLNNWTDQNVTVTVSASDDLSGVAKIEYSFEGSDWTEITYTTEKTDGTFILTEVGDFKVRVTDEAGNYVEQGGTVYIDAPTITFTCDPATDLEHWTQEDVTVTVTASYEHSAVEKIEYSLDSGKSWTDITAAGSFTLSKHGDFTVRATSDRGLEAEKTGTVYIDKIDPVINSVTQNTDDWTNEDVTLTINATDEGGSGLKVYEYLNDDTWDALKGNTYVAATNGDYTFRVNDLAGNVSAEFTHTVTNIDKVDPMIDSLDWNKSWTNQDVTVTVSASDDFSGVAKIEYTFEGSDWTEITYTTEKTDGTFILTEAGDFTVRVTDNAGNDVEQGGTVFIDKVDPVMSLDWEKSWTAQNVTVTVSASDALSGVAKIEYSLDSGVSWKEITYTTEKTDGTFILTEAGDFTVRVTDKAGNYVEQGGTVFIDKVKPVIDSISWYQALTDRPVTVSVTAYDTLSGVKKTEYSFNGVDWTEFTDTFVINQSGSFWVRVEDNVGNVTESAEQTVSNITSYTINRDPKTGRYASYGFVVDVTGDYVFTGDFGDINGTITVKNNKATVSGTIQQGVLNIGTENTVSLVAGSATVAVEVKNGSLYEYGISIDKILPAGGGIAGDLNADGRADIVMSIDQPGHEADGATGAWLIQADQTAAWGDLSKRNTGWTIFGTGKTSAVKNTDDVYLKSSDNVIGAWTIGDDGKVYGWETIGSFDSETQILGLGDFNGNGQTDLLLRNNNGAVGCYFTGGKTTGWNYFQSLGDEWKLAAIGDLNGDGRDDVVLKHDAGFAGSWLTQANGTMAWADLDTLPYGFEIVGAGDFNGDGMDDVLLKNGSYYGAWLVNNGNAVGWMGLGELGDVTVEQIADFNGDGVDDLRIRTTAGDLGAQLVMGEDTLDWNYYGSVGAEWKTGLAALS